MPVKQKPSELAETGLLPIKLTHLLKRVLLEVLKAENIQDTNEDRVVRDRLGTYKREAKNCQFTTVSFFFFSLTHDGRVDTLDEPSELVAVQSLGHGISGV